MGAYKHLPESELSRLLQEGDEQAFMELYKRFNRPIASNLLRIFKSPELAEEVLQDVFLMLWERRKDVDPEKSIGAFLFRAAVNRTKNVFRSLKYDAKMRQTVFQAMLEQQAELANDWLEQKETKAFIHQLLLQLPEQQRKVYTLCKLEGRSYKEVSQLLGIAETTVNTHVRNANRTLRLALYRRHDLNSAFFISAYFLLM